MSKNRLDEIKAKQERLAAETNTISRAHIRIDLGGEDVSWLVSEVERYREALERITDYNVETNHGPVDEWAEAEAFAAVSEIAAGALYYWEKREKGR